MAISTEIQEFVERAVARARSQTVTIIKQIPVEVSYLQKWIESHPVIPITFWSPSKKWVFTTEQSDWAHSGEGDVSYGFPDGATITAPPAGPNVEREYGVIRTLLNQDATRWEFSKLTFTNNMSLALLAAGALNAGNESDKQSGDFIVRLSILNTIRISVEYFSGSSAEQDTGALPSAGLDVLVEEEGGGNAVVKFRPASVGGWVTHFTLPYRIGMGVLSVGVLQAFSGGATYTGTVYSVERTSMDLPSGSFIPTANTGNKSKDYIYACSADNKVYEIAPEEGMLVFDKDSDLLHVWDGSAWIVWKHGLSDSKIHNSNIAYDKVLAADTSGLPSDAGFAKTLVTLTTGERPFTGEVCGVAPVTDNGLTTKSYTDSKIAALLEKIMARLATLHQKNIPGRLNDHQDVSTGAVLADNNLLAYDVVSGKWMNQTAGQAGVIPAHNTWVGAFLGTLQSAPGTGPTKVAFDSKEFDEGGDFSTTTHRFIAPLTGKYWIAFGITVFPTDGVWNADSHVYAFLYLNGSEYIAETRITPRDAAAGDMATLTLTKLVNLVAGNYVEVHIQHSEAVMIQSGIQNTWLSISRAP